MKDPNTDLQGMTLLCDSSMKWLNIVWLQVDFQIYDERYAKERKKIKETVC